MNLPFGLPMLKDNSNKKKEEASEFLVQFERKLADYRDTLEYYKKCVLEYYGKLKDYDKKAMDGQLSIVQTALDLTYIKEQEDRIVELLAQMQVQGADNRAVELLEEMKSGPMNRTMIQLEGLVASIVEVNSKLDGLDKNVVNRLSELLIELQKQNIYQTKQIQTEAIVGIEKLAKSVKKGNTLLWFVISFNIITLSALAFLILYVLEIIPF